MSNNDDKNRNNLGHDPKNTNNNNNNRRKKSPLTYILITIIFVVVISLFGYFAFAKFSNPRINGTFSQSEFRVVEVIDDKGTPEDTSDDTSYFKYEGKIAEMLSKEIREDAKNENPGYTSPFEGYTVSKVVGQSAGKYYIFQVSLVKLGENNKATSKLIYQFSIDEHLYGAVGGPGFLYFMNNYLRGDNVTDKFTINISEYVKRNYSWVPYLIMGVISFFVIFFIYRSIKKGAEGLGGGGFGSPFDNPGSNRAKKATQSNVSFNDVAGCDEVKEELVEVVDYFVNSKKYTALGAKLPKGILLQGPPGTGKTLLAKAVAGEAKIPFFSISGSDFVEMYVGVGASRVREMFKTAKESAPCLVFIDEIDAVGRQRGAGLGGGNDEREQTLNQLLVEMDGFEENSGVIIIAATNRSDVLDPALTRPGRFDRIITVDLPDKQGREAILKVHARKKKLAKDVDLDQIAKNTVGFAGADLANIMNEAAILAVRDNREEITFRDLDEAIDRRIAGPAKSNKHLAEQERKQIAYHESGHAIIGLKLPYSNKVQKITIIPRGRTGGHVLMTPEQDTFLQTKNQLLAEITGFLGGRASEEIFFGDVSTGASNDFERATQIARSMVTRFGMSSLGPIQYDQNDGNVFLGRDYTSSQRNYSDQIALEIDKEVRNIIESCYKQAKEIITKYKDDVILLAETVYEVETISANEVEYLLEHRELPSREKHYSEKEKEYLDYVPNNNHNITLIEGNVVIKKLYKDTDTLLYNPAISNIVLCVSSKAAVPLSKEEFIREVKSNVSKGKVGTLFLTLSELEESRMDVNDIKDHLISYSNINVFVIYGEEMSVRKLRETYSKGTPQSPKVTPSSQSNTTSSEATSEPSTEVKSSEPSTNESESKLDDLGFVDKKKEEETSTTSTSEPEVKEETPSESETPSETSTETEVTSDKSEETEDK